MEAAPPTYQAATLIDYLDLIATHIRREDLPVVIRVCKRWRMVFTKHLWRSVPGISPHGQDTYREAVVFNRLLAGLPFVPHESLLLVHVLTIPRAYESYDDRVWLSLLLYSLPNLQVLDLHGSASLDHQTLCSLFTVPSHHVAGSAPFHARLIAPGVASHLTGSIPRPSVLEPLRPCPAMSRLRLLDASHCRNVTSQGLAAMLSACNALVSINLSSTSAARHSTVFSSFRALTNLRILRLRSIGLRDGEIKLLGSVLGLRVRSLDVSDNNITDDGIAALKQACMSLDGHAIFTDKPATFERDIDQALHSGTVGTLSTEIEAPRGITHLYVSGNQITAAGILTMFKSRTLNILDAVRAARVSNANFTSLQHLIRTDLADMDIESNLVTLRVHHAVFTFNKDGIMLEKILSHLFKLKTLKLAEIPSHSTTTSVTDGLKALLKVCARLSAQSATQTQNHAPPAYEEGAPVLAVRPSLFALEAIVLEVVASAGNCSEVHPQVKSVTDDADSQMFAAASASDFSFFDRISDWQGDRELQSDPAVDNIAVLSRFRQEQTDNDCTWPGTLRMVR